MARLSISLVILSLATITSTVARADDSIDVGDRWQSRPLTLGATMTTADRGLSGVKLDYAPRPWLEVSGLGGWNGGPALGTALHVRQIVGKVALGLGVGLTGTGESTQSVDATPEQDSWFGPFSTKAYDYQPTLWGSIEGTLEARTQKGVTMELAVGLSAPVIGGGYACTETTTDDGLLGSGMTTTSDCSASSTKMAPYAGITIGYSPKL